MPSLSLNIILRRLPLLEEGTPMLYRPLRLWCPPRLAKNVKLHNELSSRSVTAWRKTTSGLHVRSTTLPFDSDKLTDFFSFATRGLMWHHWSECLDSESFVHSMCVTKAGEAIVNWQLQLDARRRVQASLGNGTIEYWGSQGLDRLNVSVWKFRLYGGLVLAGDSSLPDEETSHVCTFTGPRRAHLDPRFRLGEGGLRAETLLPPAIL